MNATELKKGQVYINVLDVKIPLQFTGKLKKCSDFITVYFTPVKTEENKNWLNSTPNIITKNFDLQFGNQYIKSN
jgi:hypothetical protein